MAQTFKSADAWAQGLGIQPSAIVARTSDRMYAIWSNGKKSGESTTPMRWFAITCQDGTEMILNISRSTAEAVDWGAGRRQSTTLLSDCMKDRIIKDFLGDDGETHWCICKPGGTDCAVQSNITNGLFGCLPRALLSRTTRSLKVCKYRLRLGYYIFIVI